MGVGVGCGVEVGSGVFSSMVGGWSPTTGGSVVGKVENMPGGGVGDAGTSAKSLQPIITSTTSVLAAILRIVPGAQHSVFDLLMSECPQPSRARRPLYYPNLYRVYSVAPASTSSRSISVRPRQRATCSRDSPLGLLALTFAPASIRIRTASVFPRQTAV